MHAGWRTGVEIAAKAKEAQLKYSSTNGSTEGDLDVEKLCLVSCTARFFAPRDQGTTN